MKRVSLAIALLFISPLLLTTLLQCQTAAAMAKPTEHVLGSITGVDPNLHTITVKADGTDAIHTVSIGATRTLLKVRPGAKDVKGAQRIQAADLAIGDRVDVRGFKMEADPGAINARSVILMSARDLQEVHEMQSAAWRKASGGIVSAADPAAQKLTVNVRGPAGISTVIVDASHAQFLRFSPEQPQTPSASQFTGIKPGDEIRILGEKSADGSALTAEKIYSGTFKTTAGTVVSLNPDGKGLIVKDLSTKQPVTVALSPTAAIHKLPPTMAMMLARRFNPNSKGGQPDGTATPPAAEPQASSATEKSTGAAGPGGEMRPGGGSGRMRGAANGDLSQMLNRLPVIELADLKPGDAVIVSGAPETGNAQTLVATAVIAGVEPIFQSASPRQAQSLGDWTGGGLGGGAGGTDAASNGGDAPPQ